MRSAAYHAVDSVGCLRGAGRHRRSGKSTLLNAIAGGVETDSGTVRLDDVDVTHWPEHRRASLMGRVFQSPFAGTASSLSIAENLILAARRGKPRGLGWALDASAREQGSGSRIAQSSRWGSRIRLDEPMGSLSARSAPGDDAADGDMGEARNCSCWTSTPARSTRRPRSR